MVITATPAAAVVLAGAENNKKNTSCCKEVFTQTLFGVLFSFSSILHLSLQASTFLQRLRLILL
jgi:hypothetical protein